MFYLKAMDISPSICRWIPRENMGILQIFHPWCPEGLILRFPKIHISGFVLVKTKWSQLFLNQHGLKRGFRLVFPEIVGHPNGINCHFSWGKWRSSELKGRTTTATSWKPSTWPLKVAWWSALIGHQDAFLASLDWFKGKMTGDNHFNGKPIIRMTISSQFVFDSRFAFVAISAFSFLGDSLAAIEVHRGWGFFFGPWSFSDLRFLTESVSLQQRH